MAKFLRAGAKYPFDDPNDYISEEEYNRRQKLSGKSLVSSHEGTVGVERNNLRLAHTEPFEPFRKDGKWAFPVTWSGQQIYDFLVQKYGSHIKAYHYLISHGLANSMAEIRRSGRSEHKFPTPEIPEKDKEKGKRLHEVMERTRKK